MPRQLKVAFFSRGRGRGHAYPDMEIVRELAHLDAGFEVAFVSYATGAQTFRSAGWDVIDLAMPEQNDYIETLLRAGEVIKKLKVDLVLSHEEFAALPAAQFLGVPSIFISAWLPSAASLWARSVETSDAVLLLERPGLFPVSALLESKLTYGGPMVRKMAYTAVDRDRLRQKYGLCPDCLVMTVIPGGAATEERVPIAATVLEAFKLLPQSKALHWVSQHDEALLKNLSANMPAVTVHGYHPCIDELFALSDLVITKGTYGTTMEAASLGIPTISLSDGSNPIDEILIPRIKSNVALHARASNGSILKEWILKLAQAPVHERTPPLNLHTVGAAPTAQRIAQLADKLCGRGKRAAETGPIPELLDTAS